MREDPSQEQIYIIETLKEEMKSITTTNRNISRKSIKQSRLLTPWVLERQMVDLCGSPCGCGQFQCK